MSLHRVSHPSTLARKLFKLNFNSFKAEQNSKVRPTSTKNPITANVRLKA